MTTVTVQASRSYPILLGSGLLTRLGELLPPVLPLCTAALVADEQVFRLYGQQIQAALEQAGYRTVVFCHPAGEESKSLSVYGELLRFLCDNRLSRSDAIITLGGGVTGDLGGFVAATYQRGISFLQIPTTLLSAVDASVGGKTAIDLPGGKNQVGAFWQPSAVICDTDTLQTLPRRQILSGLSEVVKYGVLGDPALFQMLESGADPTSETVLTRCVQQKRDIVQADEFDRGQRQLLNLGHTLGHAAELLSEYTLTHGEAVSIGLAMILRAAAKRRFCDDSLCIRVTNLLQRLGLPVSADYPADAILSAALGDKKRRGDTISLIVPTELGHCSILPVPVSQLGDWIRDGLIA